VGALIVDGGITILKNIYMGDNLAIGAAPTAGTSIALGLSLTGTTNVYGVDNRGQVSYATNAHSFNSTLSTADNVYTVTQLKHFSASQGVFGASSTITNQTGLFIDATLIGGVNNYGVVSNIPAGTNRWNIYAGGTAANYFAGNVTVGASGVLAGNGSGLTDLNGSAITTGTVANARLTLATTSQAGIVQLTDSTSTTSSIIAATATAVKSAYDIATAALPKAGGTVTGNITVSTGAKVVLVDSPVSGTDAVNKAYVDANLAGLSWKNSVRVATTANIALTGIQTIDGNLLVAGDRVLVKDQTTASQNGIYVAAAGAWSRSIDADSTTPTNELNALAVFVDQGTVNADSGWTQTASITTLGTDSVTFTQFNGAAGISAGVGLSKTGNVVDINLGAGIAQLPSDEVGVDVYTGGGLITTSDGTTSSTGTNAQLSLSAVGTAGIYTSVQTNSHGRVIAGTNPTTLAGYGIVDAAPLTHVSDQTVHLTSSQNTWIDAITATSTEVNYLSGVTSAIQTQFTNKQPLDADLTAIAALAGTSGLLQKTGANTWALDTSTYLTSYTETDTLANVTSRGDTTATALILTNATASTTTGTGALIISGGVGVAGQVTAATFSGSGASLTSLNASNLSSGTVAAARLPAFTGDATSTAGTAALTLATVNSNIGTFNNVTVNAKGLVTAASNVSYQPLDADLTAIAALVGTTGLLKKTAADTWTLDTGTYLTSYTETDTFASVTGRGATTATALTITNATASTTTGTGALIISGGVGVAGQVTAATFSGSGASLTSLPAGNLTGTVVAARLPAFTGDATVAVGTSAITLATVNSNIGSFNNVTVNAKGLVTAASTVAYLTAETDTFATVTGRGNTTATALTITNATASTTTGTGALVISGGLGVAGQVTAATFSGSGASLTSLPAGTLIGVVPASVFGNITIPSTFKITITDLPTAGTDAANKNYVDSAVAGLSWKQAVRIATTANITLSGLQTVDGLLLTAGMRVLVKDQTATADNGIYLASSGAWTRATDADVAAELNSAAVFVEGGTTQADTGWTQTNLVVTLGTDGLSFAQFNGSGGVLAGAGLTKTGNTLSITNATAVGALSGTNTGDETVTTIKTKLGITTLSGSNTGDQTITLTGDVTGTGTGSFAATLATVNANVGSFNTVTVNAKGLVTAASNTSYQPLDTDLTNIAALTGAAGFLKTNGANVWSVDTATYLTSYTETDTFASVTGRGATTSVALTLTNATASTTTGTGALIISGGVGVAGQVTAATFSGSGASLTALNASNISSGTLASARLPAFTGDATVAIGTSAITLATVNSNIGAFNNVTVNAKGLVTAASNVAYLTSYTETDTLASVTGRGATTTTALTITNATASTTTGTGALVVTGGLGVAGQVTAGSISVAQANTSSTTTTVSTNNTAVTIDITSATAYRSAEYLVQAVRTGGTAEFNITKVLVTHDGTTVYLSEYGQVSKASMMGTLDATIVTGNIVLTYNSYGDATTNNIVVKVVRTAIII
jgi:hypothetical protein